ncbi:toll/interleukin-1 receptor domain-containing protein [Nocardia cyriacigeorgica]|uniref:toll/interleukin-1 receptor domain-containing protein n=1 Tax=Nocardia cyriacigeorgica TaxID=135487 RepID=UPI0024573152|nr:toll/interleukin-1 receptor domain-containing protein [Nocardia cyriacigeorgica]
MARPGSRNSARTRYDIFISYSSADRTLVEKIANDLKKSSVRPWWDAWEMKPGDSLRERINDGIASARYFMVVLSSESLKSNWVKYELNSGMILDIEQQGVRVIPAVAPNLPQEEIPVDLRARKCVFLNRANYTQAVADVIDLIQPERRERAELLKRLRTPRDRFGEVQLLRTYARNGRDQTIEIAALDGLLHLGTPDAVVAITERALETWGMSSIKRAIKNLGNMTDTFGLLALSSTILRDSRFIVEKLNLMASLSPEVELCIEEFGGATEWELSGRLPELMQHLYDCKNPEIGYGAALSKAFLPTPRWGRKASPAPTNLRRDAVEFADWSLPGLTNVLRETDECRF